MTGEAEGIRTLLFTGLVVPVDAVPALEFERLPEDLFMLLLLGGVGVSKGSKVLKKTGLAGWLSMKKEGGLMNC